MTSPIEVEADEFFSLTETDEDIVSISVSSNAENNDNKAFAYHKQIGPRSYRYWTRIKTYALALFVERMNKHPRRFAYHGLTEFDSGAVSLHYGEW